MSEVRKSSYLGALAELTRESSPIATMWKIGLLFLIPSLAYVLYILATVGHSAFNTSSDGVIWGIVQSTYVSFVLTSTGLTFVASMAMVFGHPEYYPIAKRCIWLALVTLVAGFTILGLEIGHPTRMAWAVPTGMQFNSPMFWMGVWYSIYMLLLLLKFYKINQGDWDSSSSRILGIASFGSVIFAHGTLGAVFGMMVMRPLWFDGMLPFYFLTTAALSGTAFALLFTDLSYGFDRSKMPQAVREIAIERLPKALAVLLGIVIVMVTARTAASLWSNMDGLEVVQEQAKSLIFFIEHVFGLLLPFLLLLSPARRGNPGIQVFTAVSVILGLFIARYEFVIGGQLIPSFKGLWAQGLTTYTPSPIEWVMFVMSCSMVFVLYAAGAKLFALHEVPSTLSTIKGKSAVAV